MQFGLRVVPSKIFLSIFLAVTVVGTMSCSDRSQIDDCNDGIDNDGDGVVDLVDPGCTLNGTSEEPDPVACNDGIDNDGDGLIDFGEDPGCDEDVRVVRRRRRRTGDVVPPVASGADGDLRHGRPAR